MVQREREAIGIPTRGKRGAQVGGKWRGYRDPIQPNIRGHEPTLILGKRGASKELAQVRKDYGSITIRPRPYPPQPPRKQTASVQGEDKRESQLQTFD